MEFQLRKEVLISENHPQGTHDIEKNHQGNGIFPHLLLLGHTAPELREEEGEEEGEDKEKRGIRGEQIGSRCRYRANKGLKRNEEKGEEGIRLIFQQINNSDIRKFTTWPFEHPLRQHPV